MGSKNSRTKIGLIELHDPYNPEHNPQLAKEDFRQMLKKEHWYMDKGKFAKYSLSTVLPSIRQARITLLNLAANNEQGLPALIAPIGFPSLQRLKLCGNGITSIECLVHLRAEHLVELSLSWNNITSTRPLRKFRFPKLKYLNIEENNAPDAAQDIAHSHFPQLREVFVESGAKSTVVCDTLELWSAKWESRLVYELTCSSSRRIFSNKPAKMLKEKYLNLKIFRNGQQRQPTLQ